MLITEEEILRMVEKAIGTEKIGIRIWNDGSKRYDIEYDISNININDIVFEDFTIGSEYNIIDYINEEIFYEIYEDIIDNIEEVDALRDQAQEILEDESIKNEIIDMYKDAIKK